MSPSKINIADVVTSRIEARCNVFRITKEDMYLRNTMCFTKEAFRGVDQK